MYCIQKFSPETWPFYAIFFVRRLHNHPIHQAKLSALGANYLAAIEVHKVRLQWIVLKICYWPAFPPCRTHSLIHAEIFMQCPTTGPKRPVADGCNPSAPGDCWRQGRVAAALSVTTRTAAGWTAPAGEPNHLVSFQHHPSTSWRMGQKGVKGNSLDALIKVHNGTTGPGMWNVKRRAKCVTFETDVFFF